MPFLATYLTYFLSLSPSIHLRFGWYVSITLVTYLWDTESIVADHWRGIQHQAMTTQLVIPIDELEEWTLIKPRDDVQTRTYYCEMEGCIKGVYYPPWCSKAGQDPLLPGLPVCGVLLADYPGRFVVSGLTSRYFQTIY